jgi:hypothetical protein
MSIFIQLGLVPKSIFPVGRLFFQEKGWENLYKGFGTDVLSFVTSDQVGFMVADAAVAKEITTTRVECFPKPIHQYGVSICTTRREERREREREILED